MSSAFRATIGLLVISSSIIAVSYMTTKGRENEQQYLTNSELTSLRGEIKDKDQRVAALETQIRQITIDKKSAEEALQKAIEYTNDKSHIDMASVYKKCLNDNITLRLVDLSEQDYQKYATNFLAKSQPAKTYINESIPGYKKRFAQVIAKNGQTVDFTLNEVTVTSIYPECKTSTAPFANFRYDIAKNTVTQFGQ